MDIKKQNQISSFGNDIITSIFKSPFEISGQVAHLIFIVLLVVIVFGFNLLIPRDFWVQDEARYAEVVREMLQSGQWLIVHLNGYPYPDKPPVYFWLVALVGKLVGQGELAFRLVTVLSTLLSTLGVYFAGRAWLNEKVGFFSAITFATLFLTLIVGQIIRMDMLLTAASIFAFFSLLRFIESNHSRWLIIFWFCVNCAFVIKGPITLLYTIVPALVWLVIELGWRKIFLIRPVVGLLSVIAIAGAWVVAVILQGGEQYLLTIWHEQLVGRAVRSWSHKEPFYFYIVLLPLLLMPWTGLVFHGLYMVSKNKPRYWKGIFSFGLIPVFLISLISGKLFIYLQPLFPVLALAAGYSITILNSQGKIPKLISFPPVLFLLLCASAIIWIAATQHNINNLATTSIGVAIIILAVASAFIWNLPLKRWLIGWLILMAALSWLAFGGLIYYLNPLFSSKSLGEVVATVTPLSAPIGIVHSTRGILNYYAGRILIELEPDQAQQWWAKNANATLIVKKEDMETVFGANVKPTNCAIHKIFEIELKEYHVFSSCRS